MNWRTLLLVPALAIGLGSYMYQTGDHAGSDEPVGNKLAKLPVRVLKVAPEPLDIEISGFGRVEPVRTWQAVSQINGRVVGLAENFAVGIAMTANTQVISIDPRDYEIALAKAKANLASAQSDLDQLNAEENNTKLQMELEGQIEMFLQAKYDRTASLVERGVSTQTALEQANRELLTQQRVVLDLRNQIALFPVQRVSAKSLIATRLVEVEEAERNISNTRIFSPFDGRISDTSLSIEEYVRAGDVLMTMDDTNASEIEAAIQPAELSNVLRAIFPTIERARQTLGDQSAALQLLKRIGFTVTVHQKLGNDVLVWPARISRLRGTLDGSTGTMGLVVRVDNPGRPNAELRRPPLNNGTFVEVVLSYAGKDDIIAIPRSAVHHKVDGSPFVYVLAEDETLARKDITIQSIISDKVVVNDGLSVGDVIVLSDPQPAVLGMALQAVEQE